MQNDSGEYRPIIGVVPTRLPNELALQIPERYCDAIIAAGGTPLILPLSENTQVYETLFPLIDGFLLTGGPDIDPARYGEHIDRSICGECRACVAAGDLSAGDPSITDYVVPDELLVPEGAYDADHDSLRAAVSKLSEFTPEREEVECLVLSYAYEFDLPTLGICRGMQVMNVFFGGTLYLDLAEQFNCPAEQMLRSLGGLSSKHNTAFNNDQDIARMLAECHRENINIGHWQTSNYDEPSHFVEVVRDSRLGNILKADRVAANSMHHQGVRDLAPALDAVAYGTDGLIEAVEVRDRRFMMGVQWHPEFFAGEKQMGCIFNTLMMEARTTAEIRGRTLHSYRPQVRISKIQSGGNWPEVSFADYI